ncbi:hypothetical protein BH10ACT9_BH10ACT9_02580 [soil metagenome]
MRDRARRDECVIRARRGLTPRCAQCRRDGAKCPRTITIERKNIKVRLGLLQVLLTGTALGIVARYVRTYGKLGERYRANNRFIGKLGWVGYLAEEDHRRGVQHPLARSFCHGDGSIRLSMSRRSASGLTCGRFLRRRMSSAGPALDRGRGRSSATGAPSRVTTMRSPCSTRRRTSPPLFRRSRTVTVSMGASVSPVRRWCELRTCPIRARICRNRICRVTRNPLHTASVDPWAAATCSPLRCRRDRPARTHKHLACRRENGGPCRRTCPWAVMIAPQRS